MANNEAFIDTRLDTGNVESGINRIKSGMASLGQTVDRTANGMQKSINNAFKDTRIPTDEYAKLDRQLRILGARYDRLAELEYRYMSTGGKEKTAAYQRYEYDLTRTSEKYDEIIAKMREMERLGTAYKPASMLKNSDEKEIQKMLADMEKLRAKEIQAIQEANRLEEIGRSASVSDEHIVELNKELDELKARLKDLEKAGIGLGYQEYDDVITRIRDIQSELSEYRNSLEFDDETGEMGIFASALDRVGDAFIRVGNSILTAPLDLFRQGLRRIAEAITNLPINILKKSFESFGKLVRKTLVMPLQLAVAAMKQLAKHSHKATGSLNGGFAKGFKTLLKYTLGIRSLYVLFNKLRHALIEGFKNLAQFNNGINPVNTSLSNLKSALTQLKNSFATAFAPILTAIEPALTRLISLVSQAVTWIGMLFSLLGGKGTFIKAKKVTENYADSLDKAGGSAKKTHKQLLSIYDDLIVLNKEEDGGGGGVNPGDMFEEVPIDPKVLDWFDKLKSMWDMADFTELGKKLGEKLLEALKNIPWAKIKSVARKLGKSLATLINGFIEVKELGYMIGKTIAEAINTGFDFADAFVRNLHWDSLGRFIADTFNGFFETIDWELIKDTFVTGFKGLADAINAFIDEFHWDNISNTIANGLNTITETIYTFFEKVNWDRLGYNLGHQLMETVRKINWEDIGRAIASVFNAAIDFLKNFLLELDAKEVADNLWTAIENFIDDFDARGLGETIGLIFDRAVNFVVEFVKDVDWKKVTDKVMEVIKGFFSQVDEKQFESVAKIVLGALGAALIANAIGYWLKYLAAKFFARKILSGISGSVAAEAATTGIFSKAATAITSAISKAVASIASAGGAIAASGAVIAEAIFGGFVAAVAGWNIGQVLYEAFTGEDITMSFSEQMSEIFKSFTDGSWKEATKLWGEDIAGGFEAFGESVGNARDKLLDVIGVKEQAIQKSLGMKTAVEGETRAAKDVNKAFEENKKMFEDVDMSIDAYVENTKKMSTASNDSSKVLSDDIIKTKETIESSTDNLYKSLKNTAIETDNLGKQTITNLQDKTDTWDLEFEGLKDNTVTVMDDMGEEVVLDLAEHTDEMTLDFEELKTDVNENTSNISNTTKTNMTDTGNAVKSVKSDLDTSQNWFDSWCIAIGNFFSNLWIKISEVFNNIKGGLASLSGGTTGGAIGSAIGSIANNRSMPLMAMASMPIPALAQGTVIPRTASEFIAKLGDNNRETEVVSPLSTIKKAVAEAISENGNNNGTINVVLELDGDVVYQRMIELDKQNYNRTGQTAYGY